MGQVKFILFIFILIFMLRIYLLYLFFYLFLVFFFPNLLGESDNYIMANSLVTPTHIVPEWYLLPFYAILRSIPDKLGGVLAMGGSFVVLAILPWLTPKLVIKSSVFRPITRILFWFILVDFILLGWIGQNVAEFPYIEIGQFLSIFYFLYFLILLPVLSYFEYIFCVEGITKQYGEKIL